MFRNECWKMYGAGDYGYKNGIFVKHEGKDWNVYRIRKKVFIGSTLLECKAFISRTNN